TESGSSSSGSGHGHRERLTGEVESWLSLTSGSSLATRPRMSPSSISSSGSDGGMRRPLDARADGRRCDVLWPGPLDEEPLSVPLWRSSPEGGDGERGAVLRTDAKMGGGADTSSLHGRSRHAVVCR